MAALFLVVEKGHANHPMLEVVRDEELNHLHDEVCAGFFMYPHASMAGLAAREHQRTCKHLVHLMGEASLDHVMFTRNDPWFETFKDCASVMDLVISVGGDGTFLETASHLPSPELPIVGLRSSCYSAGELCAAKEYDLEVFVNAIKHQNLLQKNFVTRMQATILSEKYLLGEVLDDPVRTTFVLNDCLFINAKPGAASRYVLRDGDYMEKQISSGIWIYTGTGSTAAALSAGGEEFARDDSRFAYLVREPLSNFPGLSMYNHLKGYFEPEAVAEHQVDILKKQPFMIKNLMEKGCLVVDGRDVVTVNKGDVVLFEPAPPLHMVESIVHKA